MDLSKHKCSRSLPNAANLWWRSVLCMVIHLLVLAWVLSSSCSISTSQCTPIIRVIIINFSFTFQYSHKLKRYIGSNIHIILSDCCTCTYEWTGCSAAYLLGSWSLSFSWKRSTEALMSHIACVLVKIVIFFILPWLRTPSSSNTCHMPTAWVREWTQVLCCIIQSTSSVPTQHCLKDK